MSDRWGDLVAMVDTISITRINTRDLLSVDLNVWMNHPDDHDFKPRLSIAGTTLSIRNADGEDSMADYDLAEEQLEIAQRDGRIELRVKFQVHGMHGLLNNIHPIIADGKAKKLATANWKSVQPVSFQD